MSRLDDELRKAYRREQPPVDFTARLLERVAQQPAPRARWWQRLATLLDPPKLRWVAIGATASLLLAIGAAQYNRLNQVVVNDNGQIAKTVPTPEPSDKGTVTPDSNHPRQETAVTTVKSSPKIKRPVASSPNSRIALARHQEERELRAEGKAAKEQLMLALSIASAALSDAQKAIHDDGLNP
jgi:hypothetical protein